MFTIALAVEFSIKDNSLNIRIEKRNLMIVKRKQIKEQYNLEYNIFVTFERLKRLYYTILDKTHLIISKLKEIEYNAKNKVLKLKLKSNY